MPTISIIVPVYNAEQTIRCCIDSIISQSFTSFELILVDDGSSDSSGSICDDYSKIDERIKVIHKENGGVSSARNAGLRVMTGDYLSFIDSDDMVSEQYLAKLISHMRDGIDLVFSYATYINNNGNRRQEQYPSVIVDDTNFEVMFLENDVIWHTSPWSKLYRVSLLKDLIFNEKMHIGEDAVFLFSYILRCKSICFTSDTDYYYYFDNANSLTKRINSLESELESLKCISEVGNALISNKRIENKTVMDKFYWLFGSYTRRVLSSLYHRGQMRREDRLSIIKSLDLAPYTRIHTDSLKECVLITLLRFRLYSTYDYLRHKSVERQHLNNRNTNSTNP